MLHVVRLRHYAKHKMWPVATPLWRGLSMCLPVTLVSPAKMTELVEVRFGV